jgi:hypothetical protein
LRLNVLAAASMRIAVFRAVAPFSLAEIDRSYRAGVSIIALMLEETSVNFCETTQHNFPEDSHIHGDSIFLLYVSVYLQIHTAYNPEDKHRQSCTLFAWKVVY